VLRHRDRRVEERLVLDRPPRLDPARRCDDDFRQRIVDAGGKLGRGKAPEHDRVDGSEPRHGKHGNHGLGNHRHVDDDAIAFEDA
jgi:hypothetical protein